MRFRAVYLGILAAAVVPGSLSAQSILVDARTFALGVNAGFASTQIHEPTNWYCYQKDNVRGCSSSQSYLLFQKAIKDANELVAQLNGQGLQVDPQLDWVKADTYPPRPVVVEAWRTATQVKLTKQSERIGQLYALGINIGIAEAQASLGESRRHIVYLSLQNALTGAKGLGLDVAGLDEAILLTNGPTPMADIHNKIVLIRAAYQATF